MSDAEPRQEKEPAPALPPPTPEEIADLRRRAAERDALQEKLLRSLADYQNREKRLERDRAAWEEERLRSQVGRFLSPMDDLDRLVAAEGGEPPGGGRSPLLEAARLVQRSFLKALADCGIEPIDALGRPFDPREHEAVGHEARPGAAAGTVLVEVARGYRLRGKVFRPARVVVAAEAPTSPS